MMHDRLRAALGAGYRRVPENVRRAILVKRREPLWLERGIVFIHIPKAAGTSINSALYGRFMGHVSAADILRWGSPRLRALPRFAVTRNPWGRLVSAYRFARQGAGQGGIVAGIANPRLYQGPAFGSFERFVTEWLAPRDVDTLDGVFRMQFPYVCDGDGRVIVDHLGRVEDLRPTREFIESRIGSLPVIPRSNRSGDDVDYRRYYTPRTATLVGEVYRPDVEAFGYDF